MANILERKKLMTNSVWKPWTGEPTLESVVKEYCDRQRSRYELLEELADLRKESDHLLEHILEWRNIDPDDACKRCGGAGSYAYSNTSTWRHGFSGQMITTDVCDNCWGSGSESHHWPSWKERVASDASVIKAQELRATEIRKLRTAIGNAIPELRRSEHSAGMVAKDLESALG